jgi:GNAT superfamily N-acetyltransferase
MSEIIIREAVPEDCKRIREIDKLSLGYDYPEDKTKERLELILSMPTDKVFVAFYGKELAGYAHVSDYECKNLMALAVDVKYQGLGIGRRLLEEAERWSQNCGSLGLRLTSGIDRQGAHKFYLRCGYTLRKECKNFIKYF